MKLKKLLKSIVVFTLTAVLTVPFAYAAVWRTGNFNKGTSWTTAHVISPDVQKKWTLYDFESRCRGTYYMPKTPSVTFYSYRGDGKEKHGTTMYVQILRETKSGKWSCEYDYKVKDGQTITLKLSDFGKKHKYFSEDCFFGENPATLAREDNQFKIRIKRYSNNTDVKWWGMKVKNGSFD